MRTPLVVANWKAGQEEGDGKEKIDVDPDFIWEYFRVKVEGETEFPAAVTGLEDVEVIIAPPSPFIYRVSQGFDGSSGKAAAQDVFYEDRGAFTGETTPNMVRLLGAAYAIVGHSERRHIFGETDETVAKKNSCSLQKLFAADSLCG